MAGGTHAPGRLESTASRRTIRLEVVATFLTVVALLLPLVAVAEAQAPGRQGPTHMQKHPKLSGRLVDILTHKAPPTTHRKGLIRADEAGRIQLYIKAEPVTPELLDQIAALGGKVEEQGLGFIQARVPASALESLAVRPEVRHMRPPDYARANVGSVTTQGDVVLNVVAPRQQFGVTGRGVRVGVISLGIEGLEASIASGNLPSTTFHCQSGSQVITQESTACPTGWTLVQTTGGVIAKSFAMGGDLAIDPEGTAMLEIVRDLAPNAELWFAGATTTVEIYAALTYLAANVDIVVSDLVFPQFFPNGQNTLTRSVSQVLANQGNRVRAHINVVGNQAQQHYSDVFRNSGIYFYGNSVHLFMATGGTTGPSTPSGLNRIAVLPNDVVVVYLSWDDPAEASSNDYDLFLTDCGSTILDYSANYQDGAQEPLEAVVYVNSSSTSQTVCYQIRNYQNAQSARTLNVIIDYTSSHQFNTLSHSLLAPADAPGDLITVGAVPAAYPNQIEVYSSRGPTFDGRTKPDVVATDGVSVSGAGGFPSTFYGTSAAAPHVAGMAALLLELNPTLTRAQLKSVLRESAVPLGNGNIYGTGRVNGLAAANQAVTLMPLPAAPSSLTAAVVSASQIDLNWADNSGNESEFRVERKTGAGGSYSQIANPGANTTSYPNTGLSPGPTYYYRVRACNAKGCSAYSNEASATIDITPPSIIHTRVTRGAVNTAISITATITDNVGVDSVMLYYRHVGTSSYRSVALTAAGATYTGTIPASEVMPPGVEYYLEAWDAAGNVKRIPGGAPAAPYLVAVFTDDPLVVRGSSIKVAHLTELRSAINTLRGHNGLGPFVWTDPTLTPGSTPVKRAHLLDLRTALTQAHQAAGRSAPVFAETTIAPRETLIKASHVTELRNLVRGLE